VLEAFLSVFNPQSLFAMLKSMIQVLHHSLCHFVCASTIHVPDVPDGCVCGGCCRLARTTTSADSCFTARSKRFIDTGQRLTTRRQRLATRSPARVCWSFSGPLMIARFPVRFVSRERYCVLVAVLAWGVGVM